MTIQPSVLIWTIICFCLMMLILSKLLFKPMLAVMDQRADRIARAKEKQRGFAEAYAREEQQLLDRQNEALRQQQLLAAKAAQEEQRRIGEMVQDTRTSDAREIEAYYGELAAESCEFQTKLDAGLDTIAATFANRLAS